MSHFNTIFRKSLIFARLAHGTQLRKYTGEPYLNHCREVAELIFQHYQREEVIHAAILHDTIEDTSVKADEIEYFFGTEVADLVVEVTDVSKPWDGNRERRKAMDRHHLAKASDDGKTIKLADLISNTRSIVRHDPNFAKVYLREKRLLLPLLEGGHPALMSEAAAMLSAAEKQLSLAAV